MLKFFTSILLVFAAYVVPNIAEEYVYQVEDYRYSPHHVEPEAYIYSEPLIQTIPAIEPVIVEVEQPVIVDVIAEPYFFEPELVHIVNPFEHELVHVVNPIILEVEESGDESGDESEDESEDESDDESDDESEDESDDESVDESGDESDDESDEESTPDGQTKGADIALFGGSEGGFGCGINRDCLSCTQLEAEGCYWSGESGCFQLPRGVKKVSECSGVVEVGEIKATCDNYPTCQSCTSQSGCVYYQGECTYSSGPSCRLDVLNCANAPEDCPAHQIVRHHVVPDVPHQVEQWRSDPYSPYNRDFSRFTYSHPVEHIPQVAHRTVEHIPRTMEHFPQPVEHFPRTVEHLRHPVERYPRHIPFPTMQRVPHYPQPLFSDLFTHNQRNLPSVETPLFQNFRTVETPTIQRSRRVEAPMFHAPKHVRTSTRTIHPSTTDNSETVHLQRTAHHLPRSTVRTPVIHKPSISRIEGLPYSPGGTIRNSWTH